MLLAAVDAGTLAQVLASCARVRHADVVGLVGRNAFLLVLHVTVRLLARPLVVDEDLLIVLVHHLICLLHHGLPLIQAPRLVVLLGLLPLVLEYDAGVHVVVLLRHALRLVLLPEIAAEDVAAALAVRRVLAVLPHFRAFHLLIVDLDLLLMARFVVVAVVLVVRVALHVVVWQLRFDQVHLWAELGRLPQLRVALRGRGAAQGLAVLVLEEPRLARALSNGHVDLLGVLVVVERRHVLLWVLVRVCLAHLNYCIALRGKGGVVGLRVLRVRRVQ